jgi:outer membrane protein
MKGKFLMIMISVVLSCAITSLVFYFVADSILNKKYVWINLNKVYNEFEMKKEFEKRYEKTQLARKKITDSLEFDLKLLYKQIEQEGDKAKDKILLFEAKRDTYIKKKKEFEDDNEQTQQNFNNQILTQVNQYLKDYGKEKGYSVIFGAEGSGSIMYAKDAIEITDEAIVFLNLKYRGIK